jgi:hypothetical protein
MDVQIPNRPSPVEFLRSIPPVQRWLYVAGGVAAVVAVVLVLRTRVRQERVAVLNGESFTQSQAESAMRQLSAAGLRDCAFADGRIVVPSEDRQRYEAVLQQARQEPGNWVNRWHETDSLLGQFADGRQQREQRDEARARLISELLARLPDVEHAEIVWDEEARVGWRRPPRVRATVYLQAKPDCEISFDTIDAVRRAVASSKAHLDPADVVVMDLQRMVTYSGSSQNSAGSEHERMSRQTAALRSRIESALSDIEGVRVAVAIVEQAQAMTETPFQDPAVQADETLSPVFLSVSNAGLEVSRESAGSDSSTVPMPPSMVDWIENDAMPVAPRVAVVNVAIRVPATFLQLQLAAQIPAGAQLSSDDSERLVAQVEASIKESIGRRISDLLGASRLKASVTVETEAVPFAAVVETSPPSAPWFIAAIAGPDARTWSLWAVVFGFGASLCWWLRDVMAWHGHRAGTGGEPAVDDASTGDTEATTELPERNSLQPAVTVHGVTTIEGLLEHDAGAVRRFYAAHPVVDWALALRGETEAVNARLLGTLAAEQAAELRKAVRAHRPVRLREIEEAQQRILSNWPLVPNRAA